jgi:hypothetical protein
VCVCVCVCASVYVCVSVGLIPGHCVYVGLILWTLCVYVGLILGQCVYGTDTVHNVCVNTMDIAQCGTKAMTLVIACNACLYAFHFVRHD